MGSTVIAVTESMKDEPVSSLDHVSPLSEDLKRPTPVPA
jgi:hypothetical protein